MGELKDGGVTRAGKVQTKFKFLNEILTIFSTKFWTKRFEKLRKIAKFWKLRSREEYGTCRSRQALSNGALVAKFGFDTAENEPSKVQITWFSDNLFR